MSIHLCIELFTNLFSFILIALLIFSMPLGVATYIGNVLFMCVECTSQFYQCDNCQGVISRQILISLMCFVYNKRSAYSVASVSYTHLDVYKRQVQHCTLILKPIIYLLQSLENTMVCEYTEGINSLYWSMGQNTRTSQAIREPALPRP